MTFPASNMKSHVSKGLAVVFSTLCWIHIALYTIDIMTGRANFDEESRGSIFVVFELFTCNYYFLSWFTATYHHPYGPPYLDMSFFIILMAPPRYEPPNMA
jgi:hypothetical protein